MHPTPAELRAVLLGSSAALAEFNAWAQSVSGQKYFDPTQLKSSGQGSPFVKGFNTDFRLTVRLVFRWGFPAYYRIWFLDHLPSKTTMSYNTRDKSSVKGPTWLK
jgi:hypothetical protein